MISFEAWVAIFPNCGNLSFTSLILNDFPGTKVYSFIAITTVEASGMLDQMRIIDVPPMPAIIMYSGNVPDCVANRPGLELA